MLTIEKIQRILNDAAPEGVEYSAGEAERIRGVLYRIADVHLRLIRSLVDEPPTDAQEDLSQEHTEEQPAESHPVHAGLYRRAS